MKWCHSMTTPEEQQQLAQKIYDTIRKLLNEDLAELPLPDRQMTGVVMFWFPADHDETCEVAMTAQGRICTLHLVAAAEDFRLRLIRGKHEFAA